MAASLDYITDFIRAMRRVAARLSWLSNEPKAIYSPEGEIVDWCWCEYGGEG